MIRKIFITVSILLVLAVAAVIIQPMLLMIPLALTGKYGGVRSGARLEEAHQRAINTFVSSKGFGLSRMKHLSFWNDRTVVYANKECHAYSLQLVGLTHETKGRVYADSFPPGKNKIATGRHRTLNESEGKAVEELKRGLAVSSTFKPTSNLASDWPDSFQVLAALRYSQSCLECHTGVLDEVAGAFLYTLVPVEED